MSADRGPYRVEDLITATEVVEIVGRPKHMLWHWHRNPDKFGFPEPVREFPNWRLYDVNEVRQWAESHPEWCKGPQHV